MRRVGTTTLLAASLALGGALPAADPPEQRVPEIGLFLDAGGPDDKRARRALRELRESWRDGYASILVDLARMSRPARLAGPGGGGAPERGSAAGDDPFPGFVAPTPGGAAGDVRSRLIGFLQKQTGKRFGQDLDRWRRWIWEQPYEPHPGYATFKGILYGAIDERMRRFFPPNVPTRVRLDQIDWGGVAVNGIPPLDHPPAIPAAEASFLEEDHVVFGVEIGGEARAYPKRILAWHELAGDRLGGVEITVVYCTLCGTVIPYDNDVAGKQVRFGTSGLLYRSNKLMFDDRTLSLWSALTGEPLVGPLASFDVRLRRYPVVTTTWGAWRARHPDTTVLSLDTGHDRDYREGAAYAEYFRTDRLMFEVPERDRRLKNKDEVLALLLEPAAGAEAPLPLAIGAAFLRDNPVYALRFGGRDLVVLTSGGDANRVFETRGVRFTRWVAPDLVEDADGAKWRVTEPALLPLDGADTPDPLPRVPAHRSFWFGWYAQHPDTHLVK